MLPENMRPVPGDDAGNNMKWDSLVLDAELYMRTGNYSLLREARMQQGLFVELENKPRIALAYYLMAFYADLNGFDSIEQLKDARIDSFNSWKSYAHVDAGVVNKISILIKSCGFSDAELKAICRKSFVPASYQCHLFSIDECMEILSLAMSGNIEEINSRLKDSECRFVRQFRRNIANC